MGGNKLSKRIQNHIQVEGELMDVMQVGRTEHFIL